MLKYTMSPNKDKIAMVEKENNELRKHEIVSSSPTKTSSSYYGKIYDENGKEIDICTTDYPPPKYIWYAVTGVPILHFVALYGLFVVATGKVMWQTILWATVLYAVGQLGTLAGAHRLWSHKSYKAKLPLRFFLMIAQTISGQLSIYNWVRDHRIHHKYTETLADPHNARRGFYFSHIGWIFQRKHPAVLLKGRTIDMSDIEADSVAMFQKKYYKSFVTVVGYTMPSVIPCLWGESLILGLSLNAFRGTWTFHCTALINSAAHLIGSRPYDKSIFATQNKLVSILSFGEGSHNFHHSFPWDYKEDEHGGYMYNFSTAFIDLMAKIGQAYDLKIVPKHIVEQRVLRTGDGSHPIHQHDKTHQHIVSGPYAWGDKDILQEDIDVTEIIYKKNI